MMIIALIEIGAIASLAVYLGYWRAGVRRRRAQAWDRLVVQLQPNWIARELGNQSSWNEEQDATPEEIWRGVQGANGLWAMYEHAGVMLDMADYAARNSDTAAKVSGSKGVTSNRKSFSTRVAAQAPASPIANPPATNAALRHKIIWTMWPRCAPIAMRMPISCVRCVTE